MMYDDVAGCATQFAFVGQQPSAQFRPGIPYNGPRNLDNELGKDRVDYQYENSLHIRLQGASRYRVAQGRENSLPNRR